MDGQPRILTLVQAVLNAVDVDEAERAFVALVATDIDAANALAHVMNRAIPGSWAMWAAIMRQAQTGQLVNQYDREQIDTTPLAEPDATDTADALADRMGWRRGVR